MTISGSTHQHCVVCGAQLERTTASVGRISKHCPNCLQPKAKSTRDTSAPQVIINSELLCRTW